MMTPIILLNFKKIIEMTAKIKVNLGPLQNTMFMPLWARAQETKKETPVLIDSKAVEIIDSIDYNFESFKNLEEINLISWISRCRKYDEIINRFIIENPNGAIVNIGCGMDTYYERAINSTLKWYELDLPDVIELKRKFFSESATRKFISGSFLNTQWFEQIRLEDKVLFISAGVFCYFEESVIKDFLIKVVNNFPSSELLFDVTSSSGVKVANKVIKKAGLDQNSLMRWPLKNIQVILSWDKRIKLIGRYYTFKQKYLNLSLRNRIRGFISDFLNIQYIIHLKIIF
jgi:O-methyltransferase involved in polyketide biosynthesis